jgi:hypothetical protein
VLKTRKSPKRAPAHPTRALPNKIKKPSNTHLKRRDENPLVAWPGDPLFFPQWSKQWAPPLPPTLEGRKFLDRPQPCKHSPLGGGGWVVVVFWVTGDRIAQDTYNLYIYIYILAELPVGQKRAKLKERAEEKKKARKSRPMMSIICYTVYIGQACFVNLVASELSFYTRSVSVHPWC